MHPNLIVMQVHPISLTSSQKRSSMSTVTPGQGGARHGDAGRSLLGSGGSVAGSRHRRCTRQAWKGAVAAGAVPLCYGRSAPFPSLLAPQPLPVGAACPQAHTQPVPPTRGALVQDGKPGAVEEQACHTQPLLLAQRQNLAPIHHALGAAFPAGPGTDGHAVHECVVCI